MRRKDEWSCVRNSKKSHRFFQKIEKDKKGQYIHTGLAIADQSGFFPDETDDGILWVNLSKPVILSENEDFHIRITCSVRKESDLEHEDYVCTLSLAEALWLLREYNLPLTVKSQEDKERVVKIIGRF